MPIIFTLSCHFSFFFLFFYAMSYFQILFGENLISLFPAVCAEQPPGGEEHAAAEPSAGLCSVAGPSGHADC